MPAYIEMQNGDEKQIKAEKIDRWSFKLIYPRTQGEPELASNYNIMPKHILEPILNSQGADGIIEMWGIDTPPHDIIGFGPWIIEKYEPNSMVTFKRNDRYFFKDEWNSRLPYLDTYIFSISSDTNTEFLKFMNKELDVIEVTQTNFKDLVDASEAGGYDVWNGGYETTNFFVVFNQNPTSERMKGSPQFTWFTDKRFRQAMSYLIDRETLSIQAYNGLAEPSRGLLTPASHYYDNNVEFDNSFDPKKAMELLDDMGIRDRNGDGILEDKNNNDVKVELLTYTGLSTTDKLIAIIAKEWKANGVDVTSNQLEFNTLTDRLHGSYDFDAIIIALTGSIYPTGDNVWPSNGTHHQWYPLQEEPATEWEAEIDYLYAEAKYEPDFETRRSLYMEMYSILYDQLPLIPLVRRYKFNAVYSKWGNVYWDIYASTGEYLGKRLYLK